MLRFILIETTRAQAVYEGLGSWSKCMRWIIQLSEVGYHRDKLNSIETLLNKQQSAATAGHICVSLTELEALGFQRVDCH